MGEERQRRAVRVGGVAVLDRGAPAPHVEIAEVAGEARQRRAVRVGDRAQILLSNFFRRDLDSSYYEKLCTTEKIWCVFSNPRWLVESGVPTALRSSRGDTLCYY